MMPTMMCPIRSLFKTPTGRQSEHQKTFQKLCIECGVEYALIRTREDMERLIEGHLFGLA